MTAGVQGAAEGAALLLLLDAAAVNTGLRQAAAREVLMCRVCRGAGRGGGGGAGAALLLLLHAAAVAASLGQAAAWWAGIAVFDGFGTQLM
jgi:hypothetical protein